MASEQGERASRARVVCGRYVGPSVSAYEPNQQGRSAREAAATHFLTFKLTGAKSESADILRILDVACAEWPIWGDASPLLFSTMTSSADNAAAKAAR